MQRHGNAKRILACVFSYIIYQFPGYRLTDRPGFAMIIAGSDSEYLGA